MNKPYVKAGVVESVVLWDTINLVYLTVYAANALSTGQLKHGDKEINTGRLGKIEVVDDEVRLGAPFISSIKRTSTGSTLKFRQSNIFNNR